MQMKNAERKERMENKLFDFLCSVLKIDGEFHEVKKVAMCTYLGLDSCYISKFLDSLEEKKKIEQKKIKGKPTLIKLTYI